MARPPAARSIGEQMAATAAATRAAVSPASWAQRSIALPPSETPATCSGAAARSRRRPRIQPISSKSPEW
jgi:hypothetical protein